MQPEVRTPNLALRRARQAMRLSQTEFAAAVRSAGRALGTPNQCTKRLVQKWETGEHATCRADYLRILQAVTGLSVRELGFRLTAPDPRADPAGPAPALLTEDSISRLRHALEHPSTVDTRTADLVESATSRLFDLEHHSPARLLAPTVDRHLATVTALLTAARHETVRRRLTVQAGRCSALAGWVALDRGDAAAANQFWDTAINAAESTGEASLLACTLTLVSYSAHRRGDPATAWQLADTAAFHAGSDRRAASWALARAALYAGELGEILDARDALDRAIELGGDLPNPRPGDGTLPWTRFFDQASLLSAAAHASAVLGDERARTLATDAVATLGPARVKARAVVLAEAARVAALCRDFELCLDFGTAACELAEALDAGLAAHILQSLVPTLMPYASVRQVRELLPQLPGVLAGKRESDQR
jgi:transcriptional regulator with XRE-family HTH domain